MAGEAEKKRARNNARSLLILRLGTLVSLVTYAGFRLWWVGGHSRWVTFFFGALSLLDVALLLLLGSWSADVDLGSPGLVEYLCDGVYFSWIVLVLALFSDWAFLLLLVMPAFAGYKLLGALPSAPSGPDVGAEDERRRKKGPKKPSNLTREEKVARLGADYRGGRPKFK